MVIKAVDRNNKRLIVGLAVISNEILIVGLFSYTAKNINFPFSVTLSQVKYI